MEDIRDPENMVFGLDIGTRSVVGTVGYKDENNQFIVVAQYVKEHETRAMMDGQIHDIEKVSEAITQVKNALELQLNSKLTEVCIAAAGRVLKTATVIAEYEFSEETKVSEDHVRTLDLIGVEKAYEVVKQETKKDNVAFYCIGYSVVQYFLNGYSISNLEGHKAKRIKAELLATFLPEEVVEGLSAAVEKAGLQVVNLTLEPIAAIHIAIPERFRMLNIALLDVGAGTSDICITKDGSIIAYGMIPSAGDEISEAIAQMCLVDFKAAEKIKQDCMKKKVITYKDIMGTSQKKEPAEILTGIQNTVEKITKEIADKIIELNGGKPVSAVFVVGGGGKLPGFITILTKHLGMQHDRVALRGAEVLEQVTFLQKGIKKDSLLVTPLGICLHYYENKNKFIYVKVNDAFIKLYDNNHLNIMDAALQIGISKEQLFPKRSGAINYNLNENKRSIRGESGESAIIKLNDKVVGISESIKHGDIIEIVESTEGRATVLEISKLPELKQKNSFQFDDKQITCPKIVMVNDNIVSDVYQIKDKDEIQILDYYTLQQLLKFMNLDYKEGILVNQQTATRGTKVYENSQVLYGESLQEIVSPPISVTMSDLVAGSSHVLDSLSQSNLNADTIFITVNREVVKMSGKANFIFVDILDFYYVDFSASGGEAFVMTVNGAKADFTTAINDGDIVEIYWKK